MQRIIILIGALFAVTAGGCTGDSQFPEATGKGVVRAINSISTAPSMLFLIEERQIESVAFKSATAPSEWDDLEFVFNFEVTLAGDSSRTRVASQFLDVVADRDYTFVISGSIAAPTITLWEKDVRTFDEAATVFEARFAHTAPSLGSIDVYFAQPGVPPAAGQAVGTLAFGEILDAIDYPEGDYVLFYTTAGDPDDVLFASETITPGVRTAFTITPFDADANEVGPLAVRLIDAASGTFSISNINVDPTIQFVQASMALATSDIYIDDPATSAPVVSDHEFGDITDDVPAMAGPVPLTYTTPGDTSAILFEDDISLAAGSRSRYFVTGDIDTLSGFAVTPDRRGVETLVKVTLTHAAANHQTVDVFIVEADAGIADTLPRFSGLPFSNPPVRSNLNAGSYDIFVTTSDEDRSILAGPERFDLALGDTLDLLLLDATDPATASIVTIP